MSRQNQEYCPAGHDKADAILPGAKFPEIGGRPEMAGVFHADNAHAGALSSQFDILQAIRISNFVIALACRRFKR